MGKILKWTWLLVLQCLQAACLPSCVRAFCRSPESLRDVRGFSIKFYTKEGNFDMVCPVLCLGFDDCFTTLLTYCFTLCPGVT